MMNNKIRKFKWLHNGIFIALRLSETQKEWLAINCTGQFIVTSESRLTCTNSDRVESMLDEQFETYGGPLLLVDPKNPKRNALTFEAFRIY